MRFGRRLTIAIPVALVAVAAVIGAALATGGERGKGRKAVAVLRDADGKRVGVAFFRERRGEVTVKARTRGLPAGFHGFHVHAVGQCVPPFTTAGGHFNPGDDEHGEHAGDMPSLLVQRNGRAELSFQTDRFSLRDLQDMDGSAVIVHADPDNFANIPDRYRSETSEEPGPDADTLATGDAGARAACGVIERRPR